jgi:hypothetical protein
MEFQLAKWYWKKKLLGTETAEVDKLMAKIKKLRIVLTKTHSGFIKKTDLAHLAKP